MEFRIADTFTDSLTRLTNEEQKLVKTKAFDLQMDPAGNGKLLHRLEKTRDPHFWSARVGLDVRLIIHMTDSSMLLCYVDHHDKAYDWAMRRKLETHPKTGAAQLVEIRETVQEIVIPKYIEVEQPKPLLFAKRSDDELLGYGVPVEWLSDVRQVNEDTLLTLANHLPQEAAEALLELATGGKPQRSPLPGRFPSMCTIPGEVQPSAHPVPVANPFNHPDALRRFRVMNDAKELERALEYPWDKWTIFLHPAQRQLVERDYGGPARVAGSAGTGKTIVALHRAAHLARHNRQSRVLLTTFSDPLAKSLDTKLRRLLHHEPRLGENIEVHSLNAIGRKLYKARIGAPKMASTKVIRELLTDAAKQVEGHNFSLRFLSSEWEEVVDAWQLKSWEEYRDVKRLGRKTRLPEPMRAFLWKIFDRVLSQLNERGLITYAGLFSQLAVELAESKKPPFDFAVVDEAQDVSVPQLRFLAALGAAQPNGLFFAGDLGQRIFQQPFSWKALGVDVRGRSRTLNINYRTSHQIRQQADRLLGPEVSDVDGNTEDRKNTISVFNGPPPSIQILGSEKDEIKAVSAWLAEKGREGVRQDEIGVFVRSEAQIDRARKAIEAAKLQFKVLDETVETASGYVSLSTMHLAKGLEFRAVVVMACDDEIIPLQERIESVADGADLDDVYNTERHLLYVACTRARDFLLVTSVAPASEFLDDLRG